MKSLSKLLLFFFNRKCVTGGLYLSLAAVHYFWVWASASVVVRHHHSHPAPCGGDWALWLAWAPVWNNRVISTLLPEFTSPACQQHKEVFCAPECVCVLKTDCMDHHHWINQKHIKEIHILSWAITQRVCGKSEWALSKLTPLLFVIDAKSNSERKRIYERESGSARCAFRSERENWKQTIKQKKTSMCPLTARRWITLDKKKETVASSLW